MGDHSSEKLRFDVYTVCLVYADKLPKGYNFCNESPEAPKQVRSFVLILTRNNGSEPKVLCRGLIVNSVEYTRL